MRIILLLILGLMLVATPLFVVQADGTVAVDDPDLDSPGFDNAGINGEAIFTARCSLCHQLPEPGMLKVRQWGFIIETMQQRMQQANMPQLIEQEKKLLIEYLGEHARK